jgi:hypothetical protein
MQNHVQYAASQSNEQVFDNSITHDEFFIKPRGDGFFDVWVGVGWDRWSLFHRKNKQLRLIQGEPLTNEEFNKLVKVI